MFRTFRSEDFTHLSRSSFLFMWVLAADTICRYSSIENVCLFRWMIALFSFFMELGQTARKQGRLCHSPLIDSIDLRRCNMRTTSCTIHWISESAISPRKTKKYVQTGLSSITFHLIRFTRNRAADAMSYDSVKPLYCVSQHHSSRNFDTFFAETGRRYENIYWILTSSPISPHALRWTEESKKLRLIQSPIIIMSLDFILQPKAKVNKKASDKLESNVLHVPRAALCEISFNSRAHRARKKWKLDECNREIQMCEYLNQKKVQLFCCCNDNAFNRRITQWNRLINWIDPKQVPLNAACSTIE